MNGPGPTRRSVVEWLARLYFGLSYRLLDGSVAGHTILRRAAGEGPPVHGYLTPDDLDVLVADLGPRAGDHLFDLGSGMGDVALEIHRRTGASVTGIDLSQRAVDAADRRARRAGARAHVAFRQGSLTMPPRIGAHHAYAIDSLMFTANPAGVVRELGGVLEPGGAAFATIVMFGRDGGRRLGRWLEAPGLRIVRFDDVTPALAARSRTRSGIARRVLVAPGTSTRGRAAALLVLAEETFVRGLIARGLASRWRFVVRYR